jgi:hypothetical protein
MTLAGLTLNWRAVALIIPFLRRDACMRTRTPCEMRGRPMVLPASTALAVASSSTCPVFVARDLSALFLLRTRTCPARNAAMEACHPAWFRYVRGIRPPRHCDCVRSHLPVCSLCLEKPKNLITSADAAPVDMWTTLFALSTYPQAGAARLATLPPTAPMAAAACGRRNGWTNGRHRHPDHARYSVT